jgi:hypothetical protein
MKIGGGFGVDVSRGGCVGSMGIIEKGLAVVKDGGLVGEGGVSPSGLERFFVCLLERWLRWASKFTSSSREALMMVFSVSLILKYGIIIEL